MAKLKERNRKGFMDALMEKRELIKEIDMKHQEYMRLLYKSDTCKATVVQLDSAFDALKSIAEEAIADVWEHEVRECMLKSELEKPKDEETKIES